MGTQVSWGHNKLLCIMHVMYIKYDKQILYMISLISTPELRMVLSVKDNINLFSQPYQLTPLFVYHDKYSETENGTADCIKIRWFNIIESYLLTEASHFFPKNSFLNK